MYVQSNLSLQLRIIRLSDVFKDFTVSEERSVAAFRQYRRLCEELNNRLRAASKARFVIGERTEYRSTIGSDGLWLQRFHRVINGVPFSFTRVEDPNRNAYVEVWRDGEQVHLWKGKATGPLAGIQNVSQTLGKLIQF